MLHGKHFRLCYPENIFSLNISWNSIFLGTSDSLFPHLLAA